MKLLKEQFYDILRLLINQIGIAIFSFLLYSAVSMMSEDSKDLRVQINLYVSIFATLFLFVLLYTVTWEYGAKDRIRVDGGRLQYDRLKGLKMAGFAYSPIVFLVALALIFGILFIGTDVNGFGTAQTVLALIAAFFVFPYTGIVAFILSSFEITGAYYSLVQEALYLVLILLSIGVVQFAYTMGYKEKKLFSSSAGNKTKKQ